MTKKTFITLVVCIALVGLISIVIALLPQKVVIGIYRSSFNESLDETTVGFMEQLEREFGEENVRFIIKEAHGDTTMGYSIAETVFKNNGVDLVFANSTSAIKAAYTSKSGIPLVGAAITEYGVALGIDDFSGVVGGNVTGTSDLASPEEQVRMILEVLPEAKRVGVIHTENEPNSIYEAHEVERYLEANGVESICYTIISGHDVAHAFEDAVAQGADAIFLPADSTIAQEALTIASLARAHKMPVFTADENVCKTCGVASLSVDYYDLGVATAKMAAKILRGEADISTMPIEHPEARKVYNKEMAEFLGITIPSDYIEIGSE